MKKYLLAATVLTFASPAFADNAKIEKAIQSRSDLSSFYSALVNTGVNHELKPGTSYTVFAPTNKAFAKLTQEQYPCFYQSACREEVAQVVRNHIVASSVNLDDAVRQKGGVDSINGHFITLGARGTHNNTFASNSYTVNGKNVLYTTQIGANNMLYKIDGVIASTQELAQFQSPDYAYIPAEEQTTTVTKTRLVPVTVMEPAR